MNQLKIVVSVPFEYGNIDATSPQVNETVSKLFPYDPKLEGLKKTGAKVSITVEGEPVIELPTSQKQGEAKPSTVSQPQPAPESAPAPATETANPAEPTTPAK